MMGFLRFIVCFFFAEAAFKLFFLATDAVPKNTPSRMAWDALFYIGIAVWGLVVVLLKDKTNDSP